MSVLNSCSSATSTGAYITMTAASIYAIQEASGNNAVVKIILTIDRHGRKCKKKKERRGKAKRSDNFLSSLKGDGIAQR